MSVRVNTHISVNIKARDAKFGMKFPIYLTQIKFILNLGYHAPRPHKSVLYDY